MGIDTVPFILYFIVFLMGVGILKMGWKDMNAPGYIGSAGIALGLFMFVGVLLVGVGLTGLGHFLTAVYILAILIGIKGVMLTVKSIINKKANLANAFIIIAMSLVAIWAGASGIYIIYLQYII